MSYEDLLNHRKQSGLTLSAHAWRRMCARGITPEAAHAALRYGRVVQQDGAEVYFIGRKEVKRWRGKVDLTPHQGLHVVLGRDGAVVTVYRNGTLQARGAR